MQKVIRWILPAIQAVISAALMIMLVTSGLLPGKYMGIAAGVIVLMLIITVLLASAGNGVVRSIGGVLAIFMCGMLVFGMVYLRQIMKTLNSIAGSASEVTAPVLNTAKRSPARKSSTMSSAPVAVPAVKKAKTTVPTADAA